MTLPQNRRDNLVLTAMIVLLVAATLFSMFLYQHASVTRIRTKAYNALVESVGEEREIFLAALEWQYLSLETVAAGLSGKDGDEAEALLAALRPLAEQTDYMRLYLAYPDGGAVADDGEAIDVSDRRYFQAALRGDRGVESVVSRIDGARRFIISVPVMRDGEVAYVLFAACNEEALADLLRAGAGGGHSYTILCEADGTRILAGYGSGSAPLENLFSAFEGAMDGGALEAVREDFRSGRPGVARYTEAEDGETYVAYAPLGLNGWMVSSAVPAASISAEVTQTVRSGYLIITSIMIISAAFVLLFAWVSRQGTLRMLHDQALLTESDARYRMAIENTTVAIWDYDIARRRITLDARSMKLLGADAEILEDVPESLISSGYVHPDSAEELRALHARLAAGDPTTEGVILLSDAGRETWRYEHIRYTNLFDEKGAPYLAIGMGEDVTAEYADKRRLDELSIRAESDSMTGLLNHAATFSHIKRYLRGEGAADTHALFMIDIDDFKQVNDTLGHQMGDAAIRGIASAIRGAFRASDIVGRVGGDEFMVLVKNVPDMGFVDKKARELVDALRFPCGAGDASAPVSASVGVAIYRGDGRGFEQIYAEADHALYRAKSAGKDRFVIGGERL